jgi:hypothetical protein
MQTSTICLVVEIPLMRYFGPVLDQDCSFLYDYLLQSIMSTSSLSCKVW